MKKRFLSLLCAAVILCSAGALSSVSALDAVIGDLTGDGAVTDGDAIWLLMYSFFPDSYPVDQFVDYTRDDMITSDDAIYLLMYTFFPDEYPLVQTETTYYDVDAAFAASGKSMTADASSCFPADAEGYLINGGTAAKPYLVDETTLRRLAALPCKGTGYVKWKGFSKGANVSASTDPFDGVVPVSRLNDPVFMAACLPSEATTTMSYRVNAGNHYPVTDQQERIVAIGAIYRNENDKPADDASVTICLSNFTLILHTASKGWFVAEKLVVPAVSQVQQMYYLPWTLENAMGNYKIPQNKISRKSDHVEVSLTGGSFNGAAFIDSDGMVTGHNGTKYPYNQIPTNSGGTGTLAELCHHYWGTTKYFSILGVTGSEIDGVVVAYRAWVKEDAVAGKLVATIGADIKGSVDHQVFSGFNYALTTEPRWILGHNVGPKNYDRILTADDSEQIQTLIGMK